MSHGGGEREVAARKILGRKFQKHFEDGPYTGEVVAFDEGIDGGLHFSVLTTRDGEVMALADDRWSTATGMLKTWMWRKSTT